ncbi:NAD-dependent succinate-semialdehyde dehydrogenase [Flammeovirga agarivorans]|uniref:NAD-dependent succinate-semialdehyde dehydrogenase n=1 Tax=Flammeovirga agarivorans TaxID=2726742 RepID=A0A7X8SJZ5_9BACT|nr:NAD-dependent succinate-semialdehyde dehydrogenase [Flammeovirga agarivorans]NLR91523.1 NAD-dependent succinate-semialdehyde dehydrogenase [Flammeovirga agarivorans]
MILKDTTLLQSQCYVNGSWVDGEENKTFEVKNPFDQSVIQSVSDFNVNDTRKAILAAEIAQKEWKKTTAGERSIRLRKWFDLMIENKEDLGKILTLEQGKPLQEAIGEIVYGASFVEWFAEEAKRTYGDVIPGHQADKRIVTIKQPVGVVAAITPWNFPNAMITRKVAPALAAGCSIIVKPAKYTPLSALALGVLAERAGIPKGVFNVITSSRTSEIGDELTSNSIVRKLSFTGSTVVGKQLIKACADTVKKVSMELGGNAPFIVFADADIDQAVEGAIASKYRNAGQTCVCSNRFFVHQDVYQTFTSKLKKAVANLKLGNGMEDGVQIGPLIDESAVQFVEGVVDDAVKKGGEIDLGGKRSDENNQIYLPTILSNLTKEMDVYTEEIFGPVIPIFEFSTEEEVIDMANDTPYGLAAYFYGKDYQLVWRVAEALEYGMVGINTGMISTTVAPFGGIKESGFGKEGSKYGIDEYLEMKYMCFG